MLNFFNVWNSANGLTKRPHVIACIVKRTFVYTRDESSDQIFSETLHVQFRQQEQIKEFVVRE